MIVINITATILFWFGVLYLNQKFLRPALLNRTRFKLFALRDELAILAMKGKISPQTEEYEYLMFMLNRSIKQFGNFSIVNYIKFLSNSASLYDKVDAIATKMESHPNKEYKEILLQFLSITQSTFRRHTFLFRHTFMPILKSIAKYMYFLLRVNRRLSDILITRTRKMEEIETCLQHANSKLATI